MDKNLELLAKKYIGAQDVAVKNLNKRRFTYSQKIETVSKNLKGSEKYKIDLQQGTGIANVIITGDWNHAIVSIGFQQLDRIYKISGENTFDMFNNGLCIPYLEYSDITIYINGYDYNLQYDIVKVNEAMYTNTDYFIKQQQFTGVEHLLVGKINTGLNFNHPIEKITVITTFPVTDLLLILDNKYRLHFVNVSDLKWEFNFGDNPVNFSRIDRSMLTCDNTYSNNEMYVFGLSHHIIKIMSGKLGLAFTK